MFARLWQRFWDRAPRQLRFTRAGKVLVSIALAAGLAAMNTGNNLLFFGWGMVLSAIVVSGVLSEATLRVLSGTAALPVQARVNESTAVPLVLSNASRHFPAYAVEVSAEVRVAEGTQQAAAPYQLRIAPGANNALYARFVPQRRGRYDIVQLVAKTAYPFGFFEKSRRLRVGSALYFWCFPHGVDVSGLSQAVVARLGDVPAAAIGQGDEFFSLRPYREGDDVRRIHWRRSARSGRWVVIETEAQSGREVMLELAFRRNIDPLSPAVEHAIATLGSLAEDLLARGFRVGVRAPETYVVPNVGARQRWEILLALAKMHADAALPELPSAHAGARVALVGDPAVAPSGAHLRLPLVFPATKVMEGSA